MTRPVARIGLIINPRATLAHPAVRAEVARALDPLGLEWHHTTAAPGDGGRLARACAEAGAEVVVTLGGDGTVQEAAAALAGSDVALATLPGGNANVFARATGWPGRVDASLPRLVGALESGLRRDVHLGVVETDDQERVFVVNAGVGLDAATVDWVEQRPQIKRRLRHAGFALGLTLATARARRESPPLQVCSGDDEPQQLVTVLAACGGPYTFLHGRPLDLVPGADFSGALHWTGLRRVRAGELTGLMLRAARGRSLAADEEGALVMGRVEQALTIEAPEPVPVQADGEALGHHRRIVLRPGPRLKIIALGPS